MTTVKKFHQFIRVDRGPVNAVIIDLLAGSIFQVSNKVLQKFEAGSHEEIQEFIDIAQEQNLIIDIDPDSWIPPNDTQLAPSDSDLNGNGIELHLEEGIDIDKILTALRFPIYKIFYYGETLPKTNHTSTEIQLKKKSFSRCIELVSVSGNFGKTQESMVCFNKQYNSCWGTVVAITADGKIKPCIHSSIEIGSIDNDLESFDNFLEKMRPYWEINKDKVERCRDCEFRYVCFDCREIAMRKSGDIYAPNPLCHYNPYTGKWGEPQGSDNKF